MAELKLKGVDVIPEDSPVGESQSNGFIENAVRDLKAETRTIVMAVSKLHGRELGPRHPILPYCVSHAAAMLSRGELGPDGATAY